MKELLVVSGKGGTGKTTLTACLSALDGAKVIADVDVDAADLFILLKPEMRFNREFKAGQVAVIDAELCSRCGTCRELCRFEAISENYQVQPTDCEGCGVCARVCPEKAVSLRERISGEWYVSGTRFGPFVHARLHPGEENSGKLVALVRHQARVLAEEQGIPWLLVDGPPGIGCPVISAMAGGGAVLIVTEPTPSGLHDLRRVAELASHFRLVRAVCINKWDLNPQITLEIERFCQDQDIPLVGKITYDVVVSRALVARRILLEWAPESQPAKDIRRMWEQLHPLVPEA
jgi:MinD superfamily P-loop ATPase